MTVQEYVAQAKAELDAFQKNWEDKLKTDPEDYPTDLEEGAWGDQELAARFSATL